MLYGIGIHVTQRCIARPMRSQQDQICYHEIIDFHCTKKHAAMKKYCRAVLKTRAAFAIGVTTG